MISPPFDDPFGRKKLGERPPVKAPADLDWDAIQAKIRQRKQPANTGEPKYDSSGYLARMRQEDPWPSDDDKKTPKVSLTNCRFLNPEDLVPDETCTVACDVKILAAPSSRSVVFRLQRQDSNSAWETAGSIASGNLKSSPNDQTVQVDLLLRSPRPRPELGATAHFKVTAEHSEASAVVESPDTPVQMRNLCRYVGAPELLFRNDGACPTLDASGGLVRALAAAVGRLSMTPPEGQSPDTVVIAGFASSSGTPDHDRDLSLRRAQSIKALLGRDADAWGDLAANFTTEDIQQILSGLATGFGWLCDPGAVDGEDGPNTQTGMKAFQAECNTRYSLGLDEDGICGPQTWGAVHRTICAMVSEASGQDPSAEPSWPDVPWGYSEGEGVYACGSDFAAPDDSAADRHAETCFFESNMEPPLTAPAPGAKATLADYPVEDPEKIKKVRMDTGAPSAPGEKNLHLHLLDERGEAIEVPPGGIPFRLSVGGEIQSEGFSPDGWVECKIEESACQEIRIEWGEKSANGNYRLDLMVEVGCSGAAGRSQSHARLCNLGYPFDEGSDEGFLVAMGTFQSDYGIDEDPSIVGGDLPPLTKDRLSKIYEGSFVADEPPTQAASDDGTDAEDMPPDNSVNDSPIMSD